MTDTTDPKEPTNAELHARLTNIEQVVLAIQAQLTPKWLRITTWAGILAAAVKEFLT